jgi:hypothetical protein
VSARSGLLHDWVEHVFVQLRFACAGIVVRPSVYERLGGYDTRLRYTLDWDMWQRIAVNTPNAERYSAAIRCRQRMTARSTTTLGAHG